MVILLYVSTAAQTKKTNAEQLITANDTRIMLWENGVPGFEDRADIPEIAKDYYVKQINNPSSVVILPGGGHGLLVINSEGKEAAQYLAARGVTAYVLRYRLFREEGSPYIIGDALADTERAIRTIRSRADVDGIDPSRVGIMAFSAGGELARMALLSPPSAPLGVWDEIDSLSSRPDFGILVYPGPLKGAIETVTSNSPPLFMSWRIRRGAYLRRRWACL